MLYSSLTAAGMLARWNWPPETGRSEILLRHAAAISLHVKLLLSMGAKGPEHLRESTQGVIHMEP